MRALCHSRRYFIWGRDTVIASRLESSGTPGFIHVSEAAAKLLYWQGFELTSSDPMRCDAERCVAETHSKTPRDTTSSVTMPVSQSEAERDSRVQLTLLKEMLFHRTQLPFTQQNWESTTPPSPLRQHVCLRSLQVHSRVGHLSPPGPGTSH